jgi:hypothetical protein
MVRYKATYEIIAAREVSARVAYFCNTIVNDLALDAPAAAL